MAITIPIAKPLLGAAEQAAVAEVLASGILAQGPRVAAFEERFAAFTDVPHAVAVSSGTAALHLALLGAGLGRGDEVVTSPFTFIATANAITYTGATPVFADIDPRTFNLTPESVAAVVGPRTRAVLGVDLFGNMAGQPELAALAARRGLLYFEDACQAHGARLDGHTAGSLGAAGAFSFYATKNMTTGEGGMLTTGDAALAARARLLRQHGAGRERYLHEVVGYNLRLTEAAAAIGLVQLGRLPALNARRRENAARLHRQLAGVPGLVTPAAGAAGDHVYHQYTVRITPASRLGRDAAVDALAVRGIGSAVFYPRPIYDQPGYRERLDRRPDCPQADLAAREVVSLPVHPGLTPAEVDRVAETVRALLVG